MPLGAGPRLSPPFVMLVMRKATERLVEICMFSIFIPFLRFRRHASSFVGVSPRRILGCQG